MSRLSQLVERDLARYRNMKAHADRVNAGSGEIASRCFAPPAPPPMLLPTAPSIVEPPPDSRGSHTARIVAGMRARLSPVSSVERSAGFGASSAQSREGFTERVVGRMLELRGKPNPYAGRASVLGAPPNELQHVARFDASEGILVGPRLGSQLRELQATSEQFARFVEHRDRLSARRQRAREDGTPIALQIAGNQAVVSVHGMLSEVQDLWAWMLGEANTLYSDIAEAIVAAEANPNVSHVWFDIESGGGTVAGLRTATAAVRSMKKPRTALSGFAASAAYWFAAEVGRIEAKHDLAEFGSIGVALKSMKSPVVFDIASTKAPNKRPDPTTEEGKAAIRMELDAIHAKFAGDVAAGRSRTLGRTVSVEHVNSTFGQGGMVLAEDALKRGMIDEIR